MSIWRYVFDNEWMQRADIERLRHRDAVKSRHERRRRAATDQRLEELEDEVAELALLCRGLLTALRESGHLDPERFEAVLEAVDAEDGVIDGKLRREPDPPDPPEAPVRRRRH